MFAVRDMGFTLFELIYGRSVRTPLSLLRKLWIEEQDDSEMKTAYQYATDLRERLEETSFGTTGVVKGTKQKRDVL